MGQRIHCTVCILTLFSRHPSTFYSYLYRKAFQSKFQHLLYLFVQKSLKLNFFCPIPNFFQKKIQKRHHVCYLLVLVVAVLKCCKKYCKVRLVQFFPRIPTSHIPDPSGIIFIDFFYKMCGRLPKIVEISTIPK